MAVLDKEGRQQRICRDVLAGAPGFILDYGIDGPWLDRMTRHYGYSTRKLACLFDSKGEVIDFILARHVADAFEAVCVPADWCGEPVDVLRSMALALIDYGSANLSRHRVFLAEYERRPEGAKAGIAQQLVYLAGNFEEALRAVRPRRKRALLHDAAGLLLGQLLHAPLWWPRDRFKPVSAATLEAWVCTQIGLLAAVGRPDHRVPSAATRKVVMPVAAKSACEDWQFASASPER